MYQHAPSTLTPPYPFSSLPFPLTLLIYHKIPFTYSPLQPSHLPHHTTHPLNIFCLPPFPNKKQRQTNIIIKLITLYPLTVVVSAQQDGDLRLVGHGASKFSGRLEIFYNGEWGTICAAGSIVNEFSLSSAAVACRQMGFGNAIDVYSIHHNPELRYVRADRFFSSLFHLTFPTSFIPPYSPSLSLTLSLSLSLSLSLHPPVYSYSHAYLYCLHSHSQFMYTCT